MSQPSKPLPFAAEAIARVADDYPTPFYLYDEASIRGNARRLRAAFAWSPGFREYFAVKATPNPHIMRLLADEGCGADCSSLPELMLAERVGLSGERVLMTSNNTPADEFQYAAGLGAILNLDDLTHLPFAMEHAGVPDLISFRYNPGPRAAGNLIIGDPKEAKYGFTLEQLFDGYAQAREAGVRRFGLHAMIVSNTLSEDELTANAEMLFELGAEVMRRLDLRLDFINLGGGIGIPYRPEQSPVDYERLSERIRAAYVQRLGDPAEGPRVAMENGRCMTGPYGVLVTRARHKKAIYKNYVGVDASMANLMRPGMYGAYHHITVLGKEGEPHDHIVDVVGSLCENNDKFAIDRSLPPIERGDLLVIHDAGAHGHAMGFQYNGKLRCAEYLLRADGSIQPIRRAETVDDYFATLDFADFR